VALTARPPLLWVNTGEVKGKSTPVPGGSAGLARGYRVGVYQFHKSACEVGEEKAPFALGGIGTRDRLVEDLARGGGGGFFVGFGLVWFFFLFGFVVPGPPSL